MLTVVDQQECAGVDRARNRIDAVVIALVFESKCLRDRGRDQTRVSEGRERHPEHSSGKLLGELAGGLKREARLAGPARPCKREQLDRRIGGVPDHRREFTRPPQEGCCRHRKIRPVERLERREVRRSELVETDRVGEILQPMLSEIAQLKGFRLEQRHRRR